MEKNNEISTYSFFVVLVVSIIGASGFAFGNEIALFSGKNGIIVIIICSLISLISISLIYINSRAYGYSSLNKIADKSFGKIFGKIIIFEFITFIIVSLGISLRGYAEVIKNYLLIRTPIDLVLITLILCGIYLLKGGLESLISFNGIVIWIMIVPAVIVILFSFFQGEFINLYPFFDLYKKDILKGVGSSFYAFSGIEILYILFRNFKNEKRVKKTSILAIGAITFFYILFYITIISFFGVNQTTMLNWPFIAMVRSLDIPGTFVERWDGIIILMFMILNFAAFVNGFFLSKDLLKNMITFKKPGLPIFLLGVFIYLTAKLPQNMLQLNKIKSFFPYFYLLNYLVIPLCFFIIYLIRRGQKNA